MPGEKRKKRGIGSISSFATLGNTKTTERSDTKESEIQSTLTSSSESSQISSSSSTQELKQLDVKVSKLQSTQESSGLTTQAPSIQSTQTSKSQDAQATEYSNVEALESQVAQEPKRLIQVSEEELKRLMVEALQSQNAKASEPEKPKRLRQTVYLEPDLHKKVRHRIADTGEDISDVVNLALRQLLEG